MNEFQVKIYLLIYKFQEINEFMATQMDIGCIYLYTYL